MRRKWIVWAPALIALVMAGILIPNARAGNFHFNFINFSLGGSLVVNGLLAGTGNSDTEVTLTGYGTVTAMCENKGGKQAPGRNPIAVNVQQTNVFSSDQNGHTLVEVHAPDPTSPEFEPSPTPKQAGCPNGNWKVVNIVDGSTDWTAATVVVKDGLGAIQLDLSFTCTTTFENGVGTGVECVES